MSDIPYPAFKWDICLSGAKDLRFLPQIIYKIKAQSSDVDVTPSEISNRIFELVDQNHDGRLASSGRAGQTLWVVFVFRDLQTELRLRRFAVREVT